MFYKWSLWFLCSVKVFIIKVFWNFTSPWFGFSYPSMDFDVYNDIDCKMLHGEGVQFINVIDVTNELIQGVGALNVAKTMIERVI